MPQRLFEPLQKLSKASKMSKPSDPFGKLYKKLIILSGETTVILKILEDYGNIRDL